MVNAETKHEAVQLQFQRSRMNGLYHASCIKEIVMTGQASNNQGKKTDVSEKRPEREINMGEGDGNGCHLPFVSWALSVDQQVT